MQGVDTLASDIKLRQVLRIPVRHGPLVVLWLESWSLLLTFFTIFGWGLLFRFFLSISWNWLNLLWWWLWELFIDDLIFSNEFSLSLELKPNDGADLSNYSFNVEKLIHEPKLELVIKL